MFTNSAKGKQAQRAANPLKSDKTCTNCRFLLIKCDGEKPICGPCSTHPRDDECEYTPPDAGPPLSQPYPSSSSYAPAPSYSRAQPGSGSFDDHDDGLHEHALAEPGGGGGSRRDRNDRFRDGDRYRDLERAQRVEKAVKAFKAHISASAVQQPVLQRPLEDAAASASPSYSNPNLQAGLHPGAAGVGQGQGGREGNGAPEGTLPWNQQQAAQYAHARAQQERQQQQYMHNRAPEREPGDDTAVGGSQNGTEQGPGGDRGDGRERRPHYEPTSNAGLPLPPSLAAIHVEARSRRTMMMDTVTSSEARLLELENSAVLHDPYHSRRRRNSKSHSLPFSPASTTSSLQPGSSKHSASPLRTGHKKSNWKSLMVVTLKATEKVLDGLPIPAAKGCISIILKVIEATDVAAENEVILNELQARYEDLTDFLRSFMTMDIPDPVLKEGRALDKRLRKLAEHWEPRLSKPRERGYYFLKLLGAQSERDTLSKFLSKINQTITDFLLRVVIKSHISTYREIIETQHAVTLASILHAPHASYKSASANGIRTCLPGTRKSVLETINDWALHANSPGHPPIFWLNGLAGIGKTTIARTVAAYLDTKQRLGGSFVFLRTDDQRKDGNLLFPTLALQLSSMFPPYRAQLAENVRRDPDCVTQHPSVQFERLIRRPLSTVPLSEPLILILDALDECQPDSLAEEIIDVLMYEIRRIPFLRIFITSRPEGHIREALGFGHYDFFRQTLVLHQDMGVQAEVEDDIRLFLRTTLQEIWEKETTHQPATIWPREDDLETLVQQSGRLFIYAATAVRFIGGNRSLNLEMQLRNLLKVEKNHIPSNEVEPYMHLDQLYLNILETAFAGITDTKDQYYRARFQNIVGSIVLMRRPLPLEALARFLRKYTIDDIKQTLYYLHSRVPVLRTVMGFML